MKVLHISSGNLYGGVEVLLATLARERACRPGLEPHFALCFAGPLSRELAALGTPAAMLGPLQTRYPWEVWRARRRLAALLRAGRFDVAVCHMTWAHAVFGPVVRQAGLPLVFWMHDAASGRHWVERWAARCRPDYVLVNSRFTAGSLPKLFPRPAPPFATRTNAVSAPGKIYPPAERAAVRAKFGVVRAGEAVILQISRLERWKGHAEHLQALSRLVDLPGWVCWMTGSAQRPHEAAYLAELQAKADAFGLGGRVRFLSWQPEVASVLAAADIFCQPNPSPEPFGRVFVEALQAGLPVVATAIGGALEIVDETCGLLVPPGSPDRLADALRQLVADPGLRERLSRAGPARAAQLCDPATVLARLETVFAGLVRKDEAFGGLAPRGGKLSAVPPTGRIRECHPGAAPEFPYAEPDADREPPRGAVPPHPAKPCLSMKVLHVSSGNLYGGVERTLATLAHERERVPELERRFALCFQGQLSARLAEMHAPCTLLGGARVRYPWQVWRARRRLAALLRREPCDAVICHMLWNHALFAPVARRLGLPTVLWLHDAVSGGHWVERWAARCRPDLVVCNSRFTAGTLARLFPAPGTPPHVVIHSPVVAPPASGPAERAAVRSELGTLPDACVVIQVGRMEAYKGHADHLEALARLADVPGWVCWIVGGAQRPHEHHYLETLRAHAARLGVARRVHFLGERRDVRRLLAAADIFCQPNARPEPFGRVFIEALQARLPVVTAALGGALEIVDDSCGRLVPPGDPGVLAGVLRGLMLDAPLRAELGARGPARANALCAPELVLRQLYDALRQMAQ